MATAPPTSAAPSGYRVNAAGQMVDAYGNIIGAAPFALGGFRSQIKEGSDGGGTADGSSSDGAGDSGGGGGGDSGGVGGGTDGSGGGGDSFVSQDSAAAAAEQAAAAIQTGALFGLPRYSGTNPDGSPYTNTLRPGDDFLAKRLGQAAYNEGVTNSFQAKPFMPAWATQQPAADWVNKGFDPGAYFPGMQVNAPAGAGQPRGTNLGFGTVFGSLAPGGGGGNVPARPPGAPVPGTPNNPQLPTPQERLIESGLPANHGGRRPVTGGLTPQETQYVPPGWMTGTYNGVTGALPTPSTNNTQTVDAMGNRAGPPPPAIDTSSAQNFIKSFQFQNAAPGSDASKYNAVLSKYGANDAMNMLVSGGLWNSLGSQYQQAAQAAGMSKDDLNRITNTFGAGGGSYLGDDYGFGGGKYSWGMGAKTIPGLKY